MNFEFPRYRIKKEKFGLLKSLFLDNIRLKYQEFYYHFLKPFFTAHLCLSKFCLGSSVTEYSIVEEEENKFTNNELKAELTYSL